MHASSENAPAFLALRATSRWVLGIIVAQLTKI